MVVFNLIQWKSEWNRASGVQEKAEVFEKFSEFFCQYREEMTYGGVMAFNAFGFRMQAELKE